MNNKLEAASMWKIERKQPIQLELFSQNISNDLYSNLSETKSDHNGKLLKRYKKPIEIDPVDCDIW